jgi:hypothetical protein
MKHCSWARLKASDKSYADGQAAKCKANRAIMKDAEAKEGCRISSPRRSKALAASA